MTEQKLRERILAFTNDVEFQYHGKWYCINPWNPKKFQLGGDDFAATYGSIDELMAAPVFDGRCLADITDEMLF